MKSFTSGLLLVLSFLMIQAQNEKSFYDLSRKTVMNRLFDGVVFNSRNEAVWEPNYSERLNMPVSGDNLCYTTMDTTMYYTSNDENHAVIIFTTYTYSNGERATSHVSSPMISVATFSKNKDSQSWEIKEFIKEFEWAGEFGERSCKISIDKLGKNFYCLMFEHGIGGNMGYFSGGTTYYSLNKFPVLKPVFSYIYYDTNEGAKDDGSGYTEESMMKIIPAGDYYSIEITTKRSDINTISKRVYNYSEEEERYEPVK